MLLALAFVLPAAAEDDVEPHRLTTHHIVHAALESSDAWAKLTELCDGIGHRLSGSEGLERAVTWAADRMRADGLENVRTQPVSVPRWVRGEERATLVSPRRRPLAMLGLGGSVGTPPGGVTADVVVVSGFEDFDACGDEEIAGRIVLWNVPFTSYGKTVRYRWEGARRASERGAVASLLRSIGPRSNRAPHTGAMDAWEDGQRPIPAAAIAVEDAMMIRRLQDAGQRVTVTLEMGARQLPDAPSHNVIGELVGRERPDEIVVVGGHLDSWDVGQGALDDGGGCVVSMEALRILCELDLRPRRTLRVVLWTNEENGTRGAAAYAERFGGERHVAAIEVDGGVESPWGFGLSIWGDEDRNVDHARQDRAMARLRDFARLLEPVDADSVRAGGGGADIEPLMKSGVPGLALRNPMRNYWAYHHTEGDTVDKVDPTALRKNVAALAVMAYLLAESEIPLDDS